VNPVNQSFVTPMAGIIYLLQQYSRQALLKTAIYLTAKSGVTSGYGAGKMSALCKNIRLTPLTLPSWTPKVQPPSMSTEILSTYSIPSPNA